MNRVGEQLGVRTLGAWALACLLLGGCASSRRVLDPDDVAQIAGVLTDQAEAWNRGDLEAFVAGYAESERMTFIGSKGTITRGRAALLERYRRSYPEGQRGTLTFDELEFRRVGPDAYLVLGRYSLARPPDDPKGVFTLVFERGERGFEIIHDHTTDLD